MGYADGRSIIIEWRFAHGQHDLLPALATELVRLKPAVIVADATAAARAAKHATERIPIVMIAGDPVRTGLIASLARPGGNVTGIAVMSPELAVKRLELLKEAVPRLSRAAVVWNPANPFHPPILKELAALGPSLHVALEFVELRDPDELETVFASMIKRRAEALYVVEDPMLSSHRTRIIAAAARHRLPVTHMFAEWAEAGALMSYGPDSIDLWRRAAVYVHRILSGANPADLPVEQPTKFELVINLKTAKALGLTIPQSVLVRADEVIR
jgi:putative ABC transport system substrate-binding protein